MFQNILQALSTKYPGVSEKILGRIAENLAKTTSKEEDVETAVSGVTFQQILESYGDSRATEAQQTAVRNYEKKHGLKNGVKAVEDANKETANQAKQPDITPAQQGGDLAAQIAAAVEAAMKPLNDKLTDMETEKAGKARLESLSDILKSAPESVKARYEKDFARMTFKDDADFSSWIEDIKPDVEKITTDFTAKGALFGRPKAGEKTVQSGDKNPFILSRIKEQEEEHIVPAIKGLK